MNWVNILLTVLLIVAGYVIEYFKTKSRVIEAAKGIIDRAEEQYASVAKSGGQKRQFAIDYLYELVPAVLKPFITKEMIGNIVQAAFDYMKSFADKQLDKITDKI